MSVFNTVIKAGQARTIVQRHSINGNAHDVVLDLHSHYASAGNLTLLQTEFQIELSTMRLTTKYTGGPCKFLQNFKEKYQDLEDTTQSVVPDHEKIGQLSACVRDYADFSSIINDMTRAAKQLKSSLSFADVMEELATKAEDLKEVQKLRVNSTMVSKNGQGGHGTGRNSGGRGGKSGRGKGKPSDVLTHEAYFALTPQEKQELKSDRASFLQKYRQCQRQNGGNAGHK
jgi:hypothetical protein